MAAQGSDSAMLLLEYLVGLKEQIAEELDLRNEARSMTYFSDLFKRLRLERLAVPRVFDSHSSMRVLTMEYVDGAPIDDLASIEAFGLDPRPVVRQLMQAWILTAALHGVFHADIHAGNLHLQRDGRLAMLDWGIVARMDEETHLMLEWLLEASTGREEAWGKLARHLAQNRPTMSQTFGFDEEGLTRFVRLSLEPILTQPIGEVRMSSLFGSTEDAIALATGEAPPKRTLRDRWRLLQTQRRGNRARLAAGELETDSQRATFLAAKQLVYLERYWKMYLPEEPLLADREFVEAVLAERRSWVVAQTR
jgi:predicted unusual protein kinase regulating ubiquinone biosynthesis (AarF/ABC1/UbiB family)